MFSTPELTIAYIKRRPASAGRVLVAMAPADAAAFLETIPSRFAARAMAHMPAWQASRVIMAMDLTAGAALLREQDFVDAAKILRLIDPTERPRWLAALPRRLRRDFELSLAFPADTVGAQMTTEIITLAPTDTLGTALALVRQAEGSAAELVFVVDEKRQLLGAVTLLSLLRNPAHRVLGDLLDSACSPLSAHSPLDAVAGQDAWNDFSRLPVVTRRGELIGALARKSLRQLDQADTELAPAEAPTLVESMLDALTASVRGLAELPAPPVNPAPPGGHHGR